MGRCRRRLLHPGRRVRRPTREDWDVPATPAQHGVDLLRDHLPEMGNTSAQVVVHDDAALATTTRDELSGSLRTLDHVLTVPPPLVRMILVPATMSLLGHRNWWLPAWLDRLLPRVAPEVHEDELVPVG